MNTVSDYFGSMVFDDKVMRSMLSADVYRSMRETIDEGAQLDINVANAVAQAMKDWAIGKGATHYTHWFQPLNGVTAEKHDSFISASPDGGVIMEFSGRELIKGEPDASSFPSGGLRATFEARGYTAWDPTSYAFIKGKTLCVPTAFCSYGGHALDEKTALLRSMDALNLQALRILRLFGNDTVKRVTAMVGVEQEYFLVPKDLYEKRPDLRFAGRTLFGAMPPKGQELDDHYFGPIKPEVSSFMEELNEELWKLGVMAKTEHNEVAPSQHELACIYTRVNVSTDQNQLVMEIIKKVAEDHGFVCLLHEKPYDGVNGSGKHNNWSLATDSGINLLSPGDTPYENAQFLLFLCAVIKAVDEYQDLLRISVASAGNDHRLGANEAPPAVISMFLGDEITAVLEAIENDVPYEKHEEVLMKLGTRVLPGFSRDNTDRNRTSPFAFTGNKFEFRMPGSMASIAFPNVVINTAVANSLEYFADRLECAEGSGETEGKAAAAQSIGRAGADEKKEAFNKRLYDLLRDMVSTHKRIIFNGNGYDQSWKDEAGKRGLLNYRTTPDCLPHLLDDKNIELMEKHGVLSREEIESRYEIMIESYCKTIMIEARTMVSTATKRIAPAVERYTAELAGNIVTKRQAMPGLVCSFEKKTVAELSFLTDSIAADVTALEELLPALKGADYLKDSFVIRDKVIPAMEHLREDCDAAERLTAKDRWPLPSYGRLLFGEK